MPAPFPPMTNTEDRIARLEGVVSQLREQFVAREARDEERWAGVREDIKEGRRVDADTNSRLRLVEHRVVWLSALAAAAGSTLGNALL